jgi:peptide/nickel transport system substrate-binding protein
MLTRRDLLKSAAAGAAVAAVPGAARAQAKKKPTLTIAFPSSPETIDPHQLRSVLSGSILGLMGEGLLTRDPQTMNLQPLLAESWKNLNPNTWEIKLRRGVKFHNGEEFTAESVKFTVERAIGSKLNTLSKLTWPPSFGQDVLIVDPYTVRIITKIPDPMVPSRLAAESMCMAPAKGLAEYKDKFVPDRYIGTGPFRLAEYVVGDRVVVEANPTYWGPKPPSQRVVWQVIPDAATRLAALQRGDVDVMLNLPFPLAPNVESDPSLRLYSELSSLTHGILLNARESAPLKDRRVRQALNMAVDRQAIIKNLYSGRGHLLNTVTGKDVANTMDPGPYPYDPARAKALLAEAGFPNGFETEFLTSVQPTSWSGAIQNYLQAVGIRIKITQLQVAPSIQKAWRGEAPLYHQSWGSYSINDVSAIFPVMYGKDANDNYSRDPELEKLVAEGGASSDPAVRKKAYSAAIKLMTDKAYWMPLFTYVNAYAFAKALDFKTYPDELPRFYFAKWK